MARYALVRSGVIENVCEWDGNLDTWQPPEGVDAVLDPDGLADVGGAYTGGTFGPTSQTPSPVPPSVTNRQLRLVLIQMGLFDQADAFIRQQGRLAVTEWDYANEFERRHPIIVAASSAFGLSDDQVDDAFRLASTL